MILTQTISRAVFCCCRCQRERMYLRAAVSIVLAIVLFLPGLSSATVVRMEIGPGSPPNSAPPPILGFIDIELYDDEAPKTVANFLRYAGRGAYNNTIIHRSVVNFVIQGGGYKLSELPFHIAVDPPVQNEFSPSRSNVRGTIAMAMTSNNPDSATSEWFFNLADNSANLDYQNGGFTVFGRVLDPGMNTVDEVAKLQILDYSGAGAAFRELPVINYDSSIGLQQNNLVMVTRIPNVASTRTPLGTLEIFVSDVDMVFNSVGTVDTATAVSRLGSFTSSPNQSVYFNNGMFTLMMSGVMGTSGRVVTLYDGATNRPTRYYAYGKTQDNQTDHWYDFTYDGETGAEIKNNRIILHFVDGKRGDDDLDPTNNSITHTGAQAVVTENTNSSSQAGGGCSIVTTPSQASRGGDWIVVSLFLSFIALLRRRARHNQIQRTPRLRNPE